MDIEQYLKIALEDLLKAIQENTVQLEPGKYYCYLGEMDHELKEARRALYQARK